MVMMMMMTIEMTVMMMIMIIMIMVLIIIMMTMMMMPMLASLLSGLYASLVCLLYDLNEKDYDSYLFPIAFKYRYPCANSVVRSDHYLGCIFCIHVIEILQKLNIFTESSNYGPIRRHDKKQMPTPLYHQSLTRRF